MMPLRVAISGSTTGIGFGIAEAFVRAGARVVINSHLPDEGALERLSGLGECHFVQADLATVPGARAFVEDARRALGGRLDTLVNNAGTFLDVPLDELTEEAFDRTFALNVKGYLFAAQAFARLPAEEGANRSILCTGSTNSLAAERHSAAYDASKGAVLMLVRSLAVSLAERGIRVNGIGPGIVETPLTARGLARPGIRESFGRQIPMGRVGRPDDVGGAAVFLASEAARYITGQMLFIDGGILAVQKSWEPAP